ncbi:hypothetical protein KUTeg_000626 [Tegillarca granosa]|uniref:VWFA domain-containing protein n=1 Tax=Tegillarca granosa TaxID=220873 RepID=A0ABQ9G2F1_TEGGR|nr:hypothetical protein KUTeg_000626 [Tegillarca granosa]
MEIRRQQGSFFCLILSPLKCGSVEVRKTLKTVVCFRLCVQDIYIVLGFDDNRIESLHRDLTKAYDRRSYKTDLLNGKNIVEKIANGISSKIEGLVKSLSNLRQAIENDAFEDHPVFEECCKASSLTQNTIYRTDVNLGKSCYAASSPATSNRRYPSKSIEEFMIKNRQNNPDLIWQYYGSKEGIFVNYPSVKISNCDYDPRFRPYFASGARPTPKDVVIVTDTSGSMNNLYHDVPYLQIAKDAAITVLKTLSPNDRIGLVSFNEKAKTPGQTSNGQESCYQDNLATATAHNIQRMESYINLLDALGDTNYEAALVSAFKFFHQLGKPLPENRDRIILFLTDGKYTDGKNPLEVVKEENEKLNNTVVIFTFALGADFEQDAKQLLQGKSWNIINPSDLKFAMTSYYLFIPRHGAVSDTLFSTPYKDILSEIGLISSICQPVRKSAEFNGVVCTDLKISDLISDITYFDDGELSYAFMIDDHERAMVHPILPQTLGDTSDPVLLNIRHFEKGPEIDNVINSMIRRESGNTTYISKRIFRRGSTANEGIESKDIKSHFFWTPVKGSGYSVCVVVGEGDRGAALNDMTGGDDVFMYHRGDIANPPWKSCRHYSRFGTIERSSVMLTPTAFEKPSKYIDEKETQAMIQDYERYFTGETNANFGLKRTVRSTVIVTHEVESFWKSKPADYAIWRYIVTKDGVVRVFPGIQLEKEYDHHRRPWYWRALSQKGIVDGSHSNTDSPMAVMAIDIPIHYFYNRILALYPSCKETYSCFVIDNSGFIVMHRDFVESYTDPKLDKSYHISHKEGAIARDLVAENVLTSRICTDFEYTRDQVTYRINLPESKKHGIDKIDEPIGYELRPITNRHVTVLLGVVGVHKRSPM